MFAVGGYAEDRGGGMYSHVTVKWSVHIASPPVKGAMILDVPSKAIIPHAIRSSRPRKKRHASAIRIR